MTHRLLIDYYTAHERHFPCFLVHVPVFCFFVILLSVFDAYFLVRKLLITVIQMILNCATFQFTQLSIIYSKTAEQQPSSLKMKLTSMLTRIDYVVIIFIFFLGAWQQSKTALA